MRVGGIVRVGSCPAVVDGLFYFPLFSPHNI